MAQFRETCIYRFYVLISLFCHAIFNRGGRSVDLKEIRKILVIDLGHIGDVIRTTPLLSSLKRQLPECELTVIIGSWARAVLLNNPSVDRLLVYDSVFYDRGRQDRKSFVSRVSDLSRFLKPGYDLSLEIRGDLFTALLNVRRSKRRFNWEPGYVLSLWLRRSSEINIARDKLKLLERIGLSCGTADPDFFLSEGEKNFARALVSKNHGKNVAIAFSSADPQRAWAASGFVRLINRLCGAFDCGILLIGQKQDEHQAELILDGVDQNVKERVINLAGQTTLGEAAAVIRESSLVICNDSALLHVASVFKIPTVAIFGPTDPRKVIMRTHKDIYPVQASSRHPIWQDGVDIGEMVDVCGRFLRPFRNGQATAA